MIDFKVAKGMFFDSKKVVDSVDKATRKALSKFGAFVRTTAKQSIRKRRNASAEGSPPSSHTGLLKKFIYFGYDPTTKSVVIGPTRIPDKDGAAPETLEKGGTATVRRVRKTGKVDIKRIKVGQRPYMQPALAKELPKLPSMWRDSVKP